MVYKKEGGGRRQLARNRERGGGEGCLEEWVGVYVGGRGRSEEVERADKRREGERKEGDKRGRLVSRFSNWEGGRKEGTKGAIEA